MQLTDTQRRVLAHMQRYPHHRFVAFELSAPPSVLAALRHKGLIAGERGEPWYGAAWRRCTFWTLTDAGRAVQP